LPAVLDLLDRSDNVAGDIIGLYERLAARGERMFYRIIVYDDGKTVARFVSAKSGLDAIYEGACQPDEALARVILVHFQRWLCAQPKWHLALSALLRYFCLDDHVEVGAFSMYLGGYFRDIRAKMKTLVEICKARIGPLAQFAKESYDESYLVPTSDRAGFLTVSMLTEMSRYDDEFSLSKYAGPIYSTRQGRNIVRM
jgi:hypothetical protein